MAASPTVTRWGVTSGDGVPAAVLLPGFGSSVASDFAFLGPMLARHRPVVGVDDAVLDPVDRARRLDAALSGLDLQPSAVHLVGIGSGAITALQSAADPDRADAVRSLTLIAPSWGGAALAADPASLPRLSEAYRRVRPAVPEPTLDLARAALELRVAAAVDGDALLAALQVPVLVITCADDPAGAVPVGPTVVHAVVDSAHPVVVERPAELLALIRPFLADPHAHPAGSTVRAVAA